MKTNKKLKRNSGFSCFASAANTSTQLQPVCWHLTGSPTVTTPCILTMFSWLNCPMVAASCRNLSLSSAENPLFRVFTATPTGPSRVCQVPFWTKPKCPVPRISPALYEYQLIIGKHIIATQLRGLTWCICEEFLDTCEMQIVCRALPRYEQAPSINEIPESIQLWSAKGYQNQLKQVTSQLSLYCLIIPNHPLPFRNDALFIWFGPSLEIHFLLLSLSLILKNKYYSCISSIGTHTVKNGSLL